MKLRKITAQLHRFPFFIDMAKSKARTGSVSQSSGKDRKEAIIQQMHENNRGTRTTISRAKCNTCQGRTSLSNCSECIQKMALRRIRQQNQILVSDSGMSVFTQDHDSFKIIKLESSGKASRSPKILGLKEFQIFPVEKRERQRGEELDSLADCGKDNIENSDDHNDAINNNDSKDPLTDNNNDLSDNSYLVNHSPSPATKSKICIGCGKNNVKHLCSLCYKSYCSLQCQKSHWDKHKLDCLSLSGFHSCLDHFCSKYRKNKNMALADFLLSGIGKGFYDLYLKRKDLSFLLTEENIEGLIIKYVLDSGRSLVITNIAEGDQEIGRILQEMFDQHQGEPKNLSAENMNHLLDNFSRKVFKYKGKSYQMNAQIIR